MVCPVRIQQRLSTTKSPNSSRWTCPTSALHLCDADASLVRASTPAAGEHHGLQRGRAHRQHPVLPSRHACCSYLVVTCCIHSMNEHLHLIQSHQCCNTGASCLVVLHTGLTGVDRAQPLLQPSAHLYSVYGPTAVPMGFSLSISSSRSRSASSRRKDSSLSWQACINEKQRCGHVLTRNNWGRFTHSGQICLGVICAVPTVHFIYLSMCVATTTLEARLVS